MLPKTYFLFVNKNLILYFVAYPVVDLLEKQCSSLQYIKHIILNISVDYTVPVNIHCRIGKISIYFVLLSWPCVPKAKQGFLYQHHIFVLPGLNLGLRPINFINCLKSTSKILLTFLVKSYLVVIFSKLTYLL